MLAKIILAASLLGAAWANPTPAPTLHIEARQQTTPSVSVSISINPNAPAGGIVYTQPPTAAGVTYYKIFPSDPITFGWNFTNLVISPTSLTFIATCSQNGNSYPVGPTTIVNGARQIQSVQPGSVTQVVWDPYAYENDVAGAVPLAEASYTLQVFDERGLGVAASPGRFSPNAQLRFAMYRAGSPTPLASFVCAGCSGASPLDDPRLRALLISIPMTILACFVGGWGVIGGRRRVQ